MYPEPDPESWKCESLMVRHAPWILGFATSPLLYPANMVAYTELWADLSGETKIENGGKYVVP